MLQKINFNFFVLLYALTYVFIFSVEKENFYHTIKSDGEGYYAYLPAIYLLKDKTFQKNIEVKNNYVRYKDEYVIKTIDGKIKNKYFAGVSLVVTPVFLGTTILCKLFGYSADGYHIAYFVSMFLFSVFLFIAGILLYRKTVNNFLGLERKQEWTYMVFIIVSPCLFSAINYVVYANNYLFFFFVLIFYLILKIKHEEHTNRYLYLFLFVTGLIAIIRPTSIIFLALIPMFFDNWNSFLHVLKTKFSNWKTVVISLFVFIIPICYQLFIWKWETGSFIVWSYSGEGFNWLKPALFEVLFGYRIGILFHSPILFFCLIYVILNFRKSPFKSSIYILYFFLVTYVSAAWWCYDFETKYGLRNFNEHYVFLMLPLFHFAKYSKKNIVAIVAIITFTLLPFIRFNQYAFGQNYLQRFTQESYWKSLAFWKVENKNRWFFYKSVKPFGKLVYQETITDSENVSFTADEEFYLTKTIKASLKAGERIYFKISFDREIKHNESDGVVMVCDHYNSKNLEKRVYHTFYIYEDKLKDKEHVEIYRYRYDNLEEMDEIKLYFWNKDKISGKLKNVKIEMEKYSSK